MGKKQKAALGVSIITIILVCWYVASPSKSSKTILEVKPVKKRKHTSQNLAYELKKLSNTKMWAKSKKDVIVAVKRDREILLDLLPVPDLLAKKEEYLQIQSKIKQLKVTSNQKLQLIDKIDLELAIVLSYFYDSGIINAVEAASTDKKLSSHDWSLLRDFSKTNDFVLLVKADSMSPETVSIKKLQATYGIQQKNIKLEGEELAPQLLIDNSND